MKGLGSVHQATLAVVIAWTRSACLNPNPCPTLTQRSFSIRTEPNSRRTQTRSWCPIHVQSIWASKGGQALSRSFENGLLWTKARAPCVGFRHGCSSFCSTGANMGGARWCQVPLAPGTSGARCRRHLHVSKANKMLLHLITTASQASPLAHLTPL